jgi:hypothetical protein
VQTHYIRPPRAYFYWKVYPSILNYVQFYLVPDIPANFFLFFSSSVSSLGWFMSNQESSFVTIGQRVLANPLRYATLLSFSFETRQKPCLVPKKKSHFHVEDIKVGFQLTIVLFCS